MAFKTDMTAHFKVLYGEKYIKRELVWWCPTCDMPKRNVNIRDEEGKAYHTMRHDPMVRAWITVEKV